MAFLQLLLTNWIQNRTLWHETYDFIFRLIHSKSLLLSTLIVWVFIETFANIFKHIQGKIVCWCHLFAELVKFNFRRKKCSGCGKTNGNGENGICFKWTFLFFGDRFSTWKAYHCNEEDSFFMFFELMLVYPHKVHCWLQTLPMADVRAFIINTLCFSIKHNTLSICINIAVACSFLST